MSGVPGSGFRVQGLGLRVYGLGFEMYGGGSRVQLLDQGFQRRVPAPPLPRRLDVSG